MSIRLENQTLDLEKAPFSLDFVVHTEERLLNELPMA